MFEVQHLSGGRLDFGEIVHGGGMEFKVGDRVRLWRAVLPHRRALNPRLGICGECGRQPAGILRVEVPTMSFNPFSGRIVKFPASPRRAGRRRGKEEREAHRREARAHLRVQKGPRGRRQGFPYRGTVGAVLVLLMFALLMSGEYIGLLVVGLCGLCLLAWTVLARGRRTDPVQ